MTTLPPGLTGLPSLMDYHTHTWRCGHASGDIEEYVQAAVDAGLSEIGLTDHLWLYHLPASDRDPALGMSEEEFPRYIEAAVVARERWRGVIAVRVAVEADYIEGHEEALAEILARWPFDYVLGSVHFLGEWCFDDPKNMARWRERPYDDTWREYYRLLVKAAGTGLFDLLAHLDLAKKFGFRPAQRLLEEEAEVLAAVVRGGAAVEVSSAGLRKPVGEIYPDDDWLSRLQAAGVAVALSSDAHVPAEVGRDFALTLAAVRRAGYTSLASFSERRRTAVPLPLTGARLV